MIVQAGYKGLVAFCDAIDEPLLPHEQRIARAYFGPAREVVARAHFGPAREVPRARSSRSSPEAT